MLWRRRICLYSNCLCLNRAALKFLGNGVEVLGHAASGFDVTGPEDARKNVEGPGGAVHTYAPWKNRAGSGDPARHTTDS